MNTPTAIAGNPPTLPSAENLSRHAELAIAVAKKSGADAAEVSLSVSNALTVAVRQGELESVEFQQDHDFSIGVYFGERRASASSTDLSENAIRQSVQAACQIAQHTEADPWQGLADPEDLATEFPDLDLDHPWDINVETATDLARRCEQAAFDHDSRIANSEGASVDTHRGISLYANSHGFSGHHCGTRHSIDCTVLAGKGDAQERDYDYSSSRLPEQLRSPEQIGQAAAKRTLRRLDPRSLTTCEVPILFEPRMARGLIARCVSAVSGGSLYRRASFLLDSAGSQLFPEFMNISQRPGLKTAQGSANFDGEGVRTRDRELIQNGVLTGYVLGSYSARRLGLKTTGNAGGTYNLLVSGGRLDFDGLLREMGTGLLITEMMGQGANMLTGDYSRGAAGLWIENGEIAYAVDEITVAGNLRNMYSAIRELGTDIDSTGNIQCGSILIDGMIVAGA